MIGVKASSNYWNARDIFEVNMNRILLFCLLLLAATPHARADDIWHNIYHTLKRFFTGGDKNQPTERKYRPSRHWHARSNSQKSSEPADSSEPRVIVLPEPTPAAGDSADSKPSEPRPSPNSSPFLRSLP
jgi:hypothetical protein